ncbi:hypothetical protein [Nevskia soli]|uniref:hypothetical protein n=1 Tax=Nevskia soli TaxID=418856 RepID=UPI0015D8E0C2|nr:hypothetical protein [Nevskia soli]
MSRMVTFGLVILAISRGDAAEPNEDARVRALEQRVSALERIVARLAEENARLSAASASAQPLDIPATFPATFREAGGAGTADSAAPAPLSDPVTGQLPQELLPNLGKIGAVADFISGANGGTYGLHPGSYLGGSVQLPLALLPGGRLSYEFSVTLSQSARSLPDTSNVAQVANLAVLASLRPGQTAANLADAAAGTGPAPFAVTQQARWRAQTIQIVPVALRYSWTRLDRWHLRPYAVVGLGADVTTSNQTTSSGLRANAALDPATEQALTSLFGSAPFTGPLIGGQITSSNQLQQTRLPSGQGGTSLGAQFGGGIDWLFPSGLTLGLDARGNWIPGSTIYPTLAVQWGWRF